MNFQKLITDLESVGMSQESIAAEIGVTQGRISQVKLVRGAGFRGVATIRLLALHSKKLSIPHAA